MNRAAIEAVLNETNFGEQSRDIAIRVLVNKEPLKRVAKVYGLNHQRVAAIKRRVLEVLAEDPVAEFNVKFGDLLDTCGLTDSLKDQLLESVKALGFRPKSSRKK